MKISTIVAAGATVALAAVSTTARASLVGTSFTATITHTGIAGSLVGPAVVPHTYAGPPSIFNNPFFGSFVIASPAVAPGFDNAILVDFSLFNYSGFAGETGTIALSGLAEDVAPGSVAIFAGVTGIGPNIASNVSSSGGTLSASWSVNAIFTPDAQVPDAMVLAWNSAAVPAPGALALVGVAGLVASRRRRNG